MEIKAALSTLEKLVPPSNIKENKANKLELKKIPNALIEAGDELNKKTEWKDAAKHYYTILQVSAEVTQKVYALIQTTQMLINLGYYEQAQNLIKEYEPKLQSELTSTAEKHWLRLKSTEKLAWISDYRFDTKSEIKYLTKANNLLKTAKVDDQTYFDTFISTNHFLGRAYVLLALNAKYLKKTYLVKARAYFNLCLRKLTNPKFTYLPSQAYQYYWLGVSYSTENQLVKARKMADRALELWTQFYKVANSENVFTHYYNFCGFLDLREDKLESARKNFEMSLQILGKHPYNKNESVAYVGLAICELANDNLVKAKELSARAAELYPQVFLNAIF